MSLLSYGFTENNYNKKYAAAYAVYVMVGSFFKKCVFRSSLEEQKLKLHFMTMKPHAQYELEERVEALAAEMLNEQKTGKQYCEVSIQKIKGSYLMRFLTGSEDYEAAILPNGSVTLYRVAAL